MHTILVWLGLRDEGTDASKANDVPHRLPRRRVTFAAIGFAVVPLLVGGLIGGLIATIVRAVQKPSTTKQQLLDASDLTRFSTDFRGGEVVVLRSQIVDALIVIIDSVQSPPVGSSIKLSLQCGASTVDLGTLSGSFFDHKKKGFTLRGTNSCRELRVVQLFDELRIEEQAVVTLPVLTRRDSARAAHSLQRM